MARLKHECARPNPIWSSKPHAWIFQCSSLAEPSRIRHSSQINGDAYREYHHLHVSWNPRTTTFIHNRASSPHTTGQQRRRRQTSGFQNGKALHAATMHPRSEVVAQLLDGAASPQGPPRSGLEQARAAAKQGIDRSVITGHDALAPLPSDHPLRCHLRHAT
jgi:hypothetical protein